MLSAQILSEHLWFSPQRNNLQVPPRKKIPQKNITLWLSLPTPSACSSPASLLSPSCFPLLYQKTATKSTPQTPLPAPTQSLWKYLLTAKRETQQLATRSAAFADSFPPRVTFSLALKTTIVIPQQPISGQHVDS